MRLYNFEMQASKRPGQIVPLCLWALLLCAACDTAPPQPQPTVLPAAGDAAIQVFFTRPQALDVPGRRTDGVDKYVIADIENAATSIDIAAYDINLQSVTDALLAASLRGVQVRVVTDSDNLARSPVAQLRSVGITVTAGAARSWPRFPANRLLAAAPARCCRDPTHRAGSTPQPPAGWT